MMTFKKMLCALLAALLLLGCASAQEVQEDFSAEHLRTPEEICTAAMEVYSWFALAPLDVDLAQPDSTGLRFRVFDERLNRPELLEAVVREYFCEEIVQMLMGSGVYAEEDGYLYTVPDTARAIDETIVSTEYYLAEETEDTRTYHAAVFYADETGEIASLEEYTFLMKKIDGEWLFTSFWFFW
ncbi:MAG: hypothetical protein Q4A66_05970 [Eubacteriales bacterium]|nr:hypothetical protein [Eubacteriales bacterium]